MAPNPVPVKAALSNIGIIKEYVRQPLVALDDEEKQQLMSVLNNYTFVVK